MAEAFAVVGLVSAITSLVDLSTRVVLRLREYTSKSSDLPDSFQSLSTRLPLLTTSLERIGTNATTERLSPAALDALKAVVDDTSAQVRIVQAQLLRIIQPQHASATSRTIMALKSLAKEDKIKHATDKITQNIDVLVLDQTTQYSEFSNQISVALANLSLKPPATDFTRGICLGRAPQIPPDAYVGRSRELQQVHDALQTAKQSHRRGIVVISGLGGIGKTQLSLAYVREYGEEYSAVFWLDAKNQGNLKQSLADLSGIIGQRDAAPVIRSHDMEKERVDHVRNWLSERGNSRWLLIFDNYDGPDLPGIRSDTGYDIRPLFPACDQGNIIITTRVARLTLGEQVRLTRLEDIDTSVAILSHRSGRDLCHDAVATALAGRLDGLPLALATAGAYLGRTNVTCEEYLNAYETAWQDLVGDSCEQPLEYNAGTMDSTWRISLEQVRRQHEDAAELLIFFDYLDNKDIWYELVQAGATKAVPWTKRVTASKVRFRQAMARLQDYNLVDVTTDSYQIHPVLHDWLKNLPRELSLSAIAICCVGHSIENANKVIYFTVYGRIDDHAEQLELDRPDALWALPELEDRVVDSIRSIFRFRPLGKLVHAEEIVRSVLAKEEERTPVRRQKFEFYDLLGTIYARQCMPEKARKMFAAAESGLEELLGPDHEATLLAVSHLADILEKMEELRAAEDAYLRVIERLKNTMKISYESVPAFALIALTDQGVSLPKLELFAQRPPDEASPPWVSWSIDDLGQLYRQLGDYEKAQKMHTWVLMEKIERLGESHWSTQNTIDSITMDLRMQGNHEAAERIYLQLLQRASKRPDVDDRARFRTISGLANLYLDTNQLSELLEVVTQQRDLHLSVAKTLGILMLRRGDVSNAQKAFSYILSQYGDDVYADVVSWDLVCGGCRCTMRLSTGYWVCRSCPAVDLCQSCVGQQQNGALDLTSCVDHKFYEVTIDDTVPVVAADIDESEQLSWLQALKVKYSSS